jgi:NTP pyrophosphatase (non-canonical NTP hydrolase)
MTLDEFQRLIEDIYFDRDNARGAEGTFMWFAEEVGELAAALREDDSKALEGEFADCLAWLATLASIRGVRLKDVVAKYASGCPACGKTPCGCALTKP